MEKMTIDKKMSVAIYRSALVQIGEFMGLSAQDILGINNRLGGKLEGIDKSDLRAMADVCKNDYDLESFMVGVLVASTVMHKNIVKNINAATTTETIHSNAGIEFA